jgi:hypothetical protein
MNRIGCGVLRVLFVAKPTPPLSFYATIKHMESGLKIIRRIRGLAPMIDRKWKGRLIVVAPVQLNLHNYTIDRRKDTVPKV